MTKKVCMFCRLPVRKPPTPGQASQPIWSYRTRYECLSCAPPRRSGGDWVSCRVNKGYLLLLAKTKTKQEAAKLWNKYSGGQAHNRLDEMSICATLKV